MLPVSVAYLMYMAMHAPGWLRALAGVEAFAGGHIMQILSLLGI